MLSTRMTADEEDEVLKELEAIQQELVRRHTVMKIASYSQIIGRTKNQASDCTK